MRGSLQLRRVFQLVATLAVCLIGLQWFTLFRSEPGASLHPTLTASQAAAALTTSQQPERWIAEAARRGPDPDLMGPAGAALVNSVAAELKLKRAELEGIAYALTKSTAAVAMELKATQTELRETQATLHKLQQQLFGLETPWLGRAGEIACAFEHRCQNFLDAGESNLSAVATVAACRQYCSQLYPSVPFFAFHNALGMVQFVQAPKGRCRCYDSLPCEVVADSGYTLWSTTDVCPEEVPPSLRNEPGQAPQQDQEHQGVPELDPTVVSALATERISSEPTSTSHNHGDSDEVEAAAQAHVVEPQATSTALAGSSDKAELVARVQELRDTLGKEEPMANEGVGTAKLGGESKGGAHLQNAAEDSLPLPGPDQAMEAGGRAGGAGALAAATAADLSIGTNSSEDVRAKPKAGG